MAESEIVAMVDEDWLARTKAGGDEHPLIKAFTIAHEGDSDIKFDGILTPVRWMKSAIGWINEKLQLRTPVFNHHGAPGDNSYEGRVPIGEIVGNKLSEVGNKVATIAAMYIYPQYRNLKLDMASIEADITYAREGTTIWPTGIVQITGVALADGQYSKPGFPEATLIGSIAAFASGEGTMNVKEVKSAIGVLKIAPEDVFTQDELTGSEAVRSYISQEKSDTREHARRVSGEKDALQKELDETKEKHAKELSELKAENLSAKTTTIFNSISEERKLDEGEKHYVSIQLKRFHSESTESKGFEDDLNQFVDETLEDFGILKPALGLKSGDEEEEEENNKNTRIPPSGTFDDEMLDPDKNPLIPGGKADLEYNTK